MLRMFLLLALFTSIQAHAKEIYVLCAMGMRKPAEEAAKLYQKETGQRIYLSFASSGRLAMQILLGAPTDAFISASSFWTNKLIQKGLIEGYTNLATTGMVVVTRKSSKAKGLKDICNLERVAVGNPKLAPFGKYAMESIEKLGLKSCLKGKIIYANNVAQAAAWTITGSTEAAFIYYSDFLAFKDKLKIISHIPDSSHSKILFTAGWRTPEGKAFVKFMCLPRNRKLFERWGFEPACR